MTAVVLPGGARADLTDRDVLGAGGEGTVYRAPGGRAIKIFATPPSAAKIRKIDAFPGALAELAVGPEGWVESAAKERVGYVMRRVDGAVDLTRLGTRRFREGAVSAAAVCALFARLHARLAAIHRAGVVVGDLNAGNVLVTGLPAAPGAPGGEVHLIDAESMQYACFPCEVSHERTCDPRLYGRDFAAAPAFDADSDWYAFAVLLFSCLLYVHPYGGAHPSVATLVRRAEARLSILSPEVTLPKSAEPPAVLPDALREVFVRVFDGGERGPFPAAALAARFTRCSCGLEHGLARCPRCTARVVAPAVVSRGAVRCTLHVSAGAGRFALVTLDGGRLAYVIDDGGVLRREDGTRVPVPLGPGARVFVSGADTWIARGDEVARARGGRVVERFSVDVGLGEPLFVATSAGALFVRDGVLTRVDAGTRVGAVLASRARLFAAGSMVFGAWDVGRAGVAFVADAARGPLTTAEAPPPGGRVVDASFVAGGELGLFSRDVDRGGAVTTEHHVVDARGRLVASRSAPEDDPTFGAAPSRCLAHGRLLLATHAGLALCSIDRAAGAIDVARTFPETRGLVGPGDVLIPAPGGALFVADERAVRLLTLTQPA